MQPDTDYMPGCRDGVKCLNCGLVWQKHHGWSCNRTDLAHRSKLPAHKQYLTPDMRQPGYMPPGQVVPAPTSTPVKEIPADWRTWRDVNRRSDECPCGGTVGVCLYHSA